MMTRVCLSVNRTNEKSYGRIIMKFGEYGQTMDRIKQVLPLDIIGHFGDGLPRQSIALVLTT